jgi:hypothetical protein
MEYHDVFAELAHPDFKQYDLQFANRNNGRIALSFRADEKVQKEMHLVEMEMVTA